MEILLSTLKWSVIVGAVTLALWLLKPRMDRRYSPKWRYWAWLVMAAALLLAPVRWDSLLPTAEAVTPRVVIDVPYRQVTVGDMTGVRTQTYHDGDDPERTLPPNRGEIGLFTTSPREDLELAYRTAGVTIKAETILTALWILGAAVFFLYHLLGSGLFSRRQRRWSLPPDGATALRYQAAAEALGIKDAPQLRLSSQVGSPMVVGLLRPRLLLPAGAADGQELDFILRHELTHYRRRDLWYQLLMMAANALHWFNPLVYLMRRMAAADLELTCDEAVMAGADDETRRSYGKALLSAVHRQKGLERAALSTNFYGGAAVMRDRLRNLLGSGGRKRGAVALAVVLAMTFVTACAVQLNQAQPPDQERQGEPLTEEEIAGWQEKLSSMELNGFVTRMYTDVRHLPLGELLYDGAGISHTPTEKELKALLANWGEDPDTGKFGVARSSVEAFLQDNTGYGMDEFRGGMSGWTYLNDFDSYYTAHGDTNYVIVTVTGGTKDGDTVSLELELPGGNATGGVTGGTMTVVDGKIRSFTNDLYTAVETMAWDIVEQNVKSIEETDAAPKIVDSYISGLWSYTSCEAGEKTYSVWNLEYRLKPDDVSKVMLAGGMREENGWITETQSVGSPAIIVSQDQAGSAALEEVVYDSVRWERGYTWEEYIVCHIHLGMDIGYRLGGWPEIGTPFITERLEGESAWAENRGEVILRYLSQQGRIAEEITTEREFDISASGSGDMSALMKAKCGGETVTLFMSHIIYPVDGWDAAATFWIVNGVMWGDGTTQTLESGNNDPLFETHISGKREGAVYLYGKKMDNGTYGIRQVDVAWSDGSGGTSLYARDGIVDQWGRDSSDYYTEAGDETGGLALADFNFDGYTDVALQAWISASNSPYYYWLYNPETGTFDYAVCLNGTVERDEENRRLAVSSVDQAEAVQYREYWQSDEAGMLFLARRDTLRLENGAYVLSGSELYDRDGNVIASGEPRT